MSNRPIADRVWLSRPDAHDFSEEPPVRSERYVEFIRADIHAAVVAERDALAARVRELEAQYAKVLGHANRQEDRAELAEERAAKLVEDAAFIQRQRASAMLRRNLNAPEDAHVQTLCERYGYGAVMDAASRLWAREDSMGAFYIGGCIGMKTDADAISTVKWEETT